LTNSDVEDILLDENANSYNTENFQLHVVVSRAIYAMTFQ